MEQLPTILGALVLAAVLWVVKATTENTKALAVLQSTIKETVLPELGRLRKNAHDVRDLAQAAVSATDLLEQRATQVDKELAALWNAGPERRAIT